MTTTYDVPAEKLVAKAAEALKQLGSVKPPEWARFAKTGVCSERPPDQKDWWYLRSAAVLRKIYIAGPIGIRHLCKAYGKKKSLGVRPATVYPSSGSVMRKVVQQLEKSGFIVRIDKGKRTLGRTLTPKGRKFLDGLSHQVKTAS